MSQETIFEYTKIDPWFLSQLGELHEAEQWLKTQSLDSISYDDLLATKQRGFSDVQIARCMGAPPCLVACPHSPVTHALLVMRQSCMHYLLLSFSGITYTCEDSHPPKKLSWHKSR